MRKKMHKPVRRRREMRQKGSALLVSLMVMVGLSLLGLAFVAISETENAISLNERNKTQTNAIAEAGAKLVVEFFQDPEEFEDREILPDNDDDFKILRELEGYSGRYKPDNADERLFDQPYADDEGDKFYGDEDNADVHIYYDGGDGTTYLNRLNGYLFADTEGGRIVEIKVFAPPIVGGTLLEGFWLGGQRYGLATVSVTAEKENARGAVIARSTCRIVIAPFPLPGPTGPVQVIGTYNPNGSYEVHWGGVESEEAAELYVKRKATSLPRFDPYDYAYFEHGYDSSRAWAANTAYYTSPSGDWPLGEVVRPSDGTPAGYEFVCTQAGTSHATTEPVWENYLDGDEITDGTAKWKVRPVETAYPISTGSGSPRSGYDNHNWLVEMIDRGVYDPWFEVRTRGYIDDLSGANNSYNAGGAECTSRGWDCNSQVFEYAATAGANMSSATNGAGSFVNENRPSHYFQYQTANNKYEYKLVDIPGFDYEFWKAAAQAGRGEEGVFYLRHTGAASSNTFSDGLVTKSFEQWLNDEEGLLFFDSATNYNPQTLTGAAKDAALVNHAANPCNNANKGAKGMIYGNFVSMSSSGCNPNEDGYFNQPGEPYRDIGYRQVNESSSGTQIEKQFTTDAAGDDYVIVDAYNGQWDYQDLPFSNGGTEKNGFFDVCVAQRTMRKESTGASMTIWVPLPYFNDCTVGNNIDTPSCNCSEPHEPYLNINYTGEKGDDPPGEPITAEWEDPDSNDSSWPKKTVDDTPLGALETCTKDDVASKEGQKKCATNAWDEMGGMANLEGNSYPAIIGVLYNEGDYASSGNASYYGAIVAGGEANPQGTQEVWFDACLVNGCWPPPDISFPRVMITSIHIQ